MTDNVIDVRLPLELGKFKRLQSEHVEKYKDAPLCAMLSSFLAHHNVRTLMELGSNEREELKTRMTRVLEMLEQTSKELLAEYGVTEESMLSGGERKAYDARIKAVVLREDHYP